jgi:hypothetical protein
MFVGGCVVIFCPIMGIAKDKKGVWSLYNNNSNVVV